MAVNLLLSFAFHGDNGLGAVADRACGHVMVDSGAFTAHRTGAPVRLADYAAFLAQWRGVWDHAITLDLIGDPAATARNTRVLHGRGLPVLPVFTAGTSLAEFDAMIADTGYVAVGGLAGRRIGQATVAARLGMLQRRAADAGGGIHALGCGAVTTLQRARPYSADSSSAAGAIRFGKLAYFDGRNVQHNTRITDRALITRDRDHITAHGLPISQLMRAGRVPGGDGRAPLHHAAVLAFSVADEVLRRARPVPAPRGDGESGTHLYSALVLDEQPRIAAELARALHARDAATRWPVWRRYGTRHTCRPMPRIPEAR